MSRTAESDPEVLADETYPVTMEAIVRYAGASGDFTPVHYDAAALTESGYSRFFAMGMLVAGRLGALVQRRFPDHEVSRFRIRFHEPSWVGTNVTCRLTGPADPPAGDQHTIGLSADDDQGHLIASGEAILSLPRE